MFVFTIQPVASLRLGDESLAYKLGMQAAISSFIFQLPGLLLLFEIHAADPATSHAFFSSSPPASSSTAGHFRRVAARMAGGSVVYL